LPLSRGVAARRARPEPVCRCESAPAARCAMSLPERTQAALLQALQPDAECLFPWFASSQITHPHGGRTAVIDAGSHSGYDRPGNTKDSFFLCLGCRDIGKEHAG